MNTLIEILSAAVDFERKAQQFYLNAASRARDERATAVLRALAQDEEEHAQIIMRYSKVLHPMTVQEAADLPALDHLSSELDATLRTTIAQVPSDATLNGVYQQALAFEIKNRDFYAQQAAEAAGQPVEKLFRFLAAIEQTHVEAMELLLAQ
jgi:rubrerythrin